MTLLQFFVVTVCLISFLMSIILLTFKNQKSKAHIYLSVYMGLVFLTYLLKFFDEAQSKWVIFTYILLIPSMLCMIPLLYMYVKKLTNFKYRFNVFLFIQFLPALIVLIINIFSFGLIPLEDKILLTSGQVINPDITYKIEIYAKTYTISQYIYDIQVIAYLVLMLIMLSKHKNRISNEFSFRENISLTWLQVFVVTFLIASFTDISLYTFVGYIVSSINDEAKNTTLALINGYDIVSTGIAVLYTSFLGFYGIRQMDIYSESKHLSTRLNHENSTTENNDIQNLSDDSIDVENEIEDKKSYKYELTESQKEKILNDALEIMIKEKLYLNSTLTLSDLSSLIKTNKNYLSAVINEKLKVNFFHFVNEFRVNEAIRLMNDPLFQNLSLEGIAKTAGFNSKSVFNPAFKKFTGKTPSEYKKEKKQNL